MAWIEKRKTKSGELRFHVYWREDGRKRSKTCPTKPEANAVLAEVERRQRLGAHAPTEPSKELVTDYLEAWFRTQGHRWQASTRKQRAGVLDRWIEPYLDGVRFFDFGPREVADWFARIRDDRAPATQANHALSILSAAFGCAVRDGRLDRNPCEAVKRVPVAVKRPRTLTPLEVERIRAQMRTPRDFLLVGLLAYAGLRPSEAFALTWGSVAEDHLLVDASFVEGVLKGTKTGLLRRVELVAPLAYDLERFRPRTARPDDLVAPNQVGRPLDLRVWRRRVWKQACNRAGVAASPYDGRHTFASLLANEGHLIGYVAVQLGHRVVDTTERYQHLFGPDQLRHRTPMVDAILDARAEVGGAFAPPVPHDGTVTVLRSAIR